MFQKLRRDVLHLKNPTVKEIDEAIKRLSMHQDKRPVLFSYIGHGIEVDGMINCPIVDASKPSLRELYPIEKKIYDIRNAKNKH